MIMKKAFTLLFLVISMSVFAQSGITPGAKWLYNSSYMTGFEKSIYTYYKDTIIDGNTCAVLSDTVNLSFIGIPSLKRSFDKYTYIKNDSMFWYIDSAFRLTCAFNHQAGDTVEFYQINICDTFLPKFVVDWVGSRVYQNNKTRKVIYYRLLSSKFEQTWGRLKRITAIEGIGWLYEPKAVYTSCFIDDVAPLLWCYKDDSLNINSDPDCFRTITSIDDSKIESSLLQSNWVKDKLSLNITSPTHLALFDINGRLLFERNVSDNTSIDVSSYPTGIYFLKARSKQQYKTYKVFKTD